MTATIPPTSANPPLRVMIIGINYAPEIISTAVYTTGLAEYLTKKGHCVFVITALPYYPAWRIFDGWRGLWRKVQPQPGLNIVHCPLYVPRKPSGAKRILHHASFAISALPIALWRAIFQRPDLVFVVAPSLVAAPVGWLAAKLSGAKKWLHIQDLEVDAAFATGLINPTSKIASAARRFETWTLGRFDRISTISQPMIEKLIEKNVPRNKLYEFRNWSDLSKIRPQSGPSPLRAELGIHTPYIALYSGNLANKQGLEILPAIAKILAHRQDLTIVICGDGPMRNSLQKLAEGAENIRFIPLQTVDRLNDLLAMADVHLLPQIAEAADLVLPSKLTNMLASGTPILATATQATALCHEVEGAGIVTPPGDAQSAASALQTLLDSPKLRANLGEQARQRAIDRWDMTSVLDRVEIEIRNEVTI